MSLSIMTFNYGNYTENTNITIYANTTIIGEIHNIDITSRNSTTLTFTWNTTGTAKGNYTITAKATPVPGETDTTDNTLTDGWIMVTIPGDINGDCLVAIEDWALVLNTHIWTFPGHPDWNPNADINNDGKVDITDIVLVRKHFWEHC